MAKVMIRALWFQPEVGLHGYYGAVLADGTPVALCSAEKWALGPNDSLRRGWDGNVRIFTTPKAVYTDISEKQLRRDGLGSGKLLLTPPRL